MKASCLSGNPSEEILQAFLLEVDNILTASVVTELADYLGEMLYGYVPHYSTAHKEELRAKLDSIEENTDMVMRFNALFHVDGDLLHSTFFWIFEKKLIDAIHAKADEETLDKLQTKLEDLEQVFF